MKKIITRIGIAISLCLLWAGLAFAAAVNVLPTGDGDISGTWTYSSGSTGYNLVDETSGGDADYIVSPNVASTYYYFTFPAITSSTVPTGSTIQDVKITYRIKDSSGTNNMRAALKINGTRYGTTDAGGNPTTFFGDRTYTFTTNPATSAAWTIADIRGTGSNPLQQFGMNSTDSVPPMTVSQIYMTIDYTDPFSDNFETNNLNNWTGTTTNNGTAATSSTVAHGGTYSLKIHTNAASPDGNMAYPYKSISMGAEVWSKFWAYFPSSNVYDHGEAYLVQTCEGSNCANQLATHGLIPHTWSLLAYANSVSPPASYDNDTGKFIIQPDTWYCIETRDFTDNTVGKIETWVNGVKAAVYTGDTKLTAVGPGQFNLGQIWTYDSQPAIDVYYDDVQVGTEQFGCTKSIPAISTFTDNFNDNSIDTTKWAYVDWNDGTAGTMSEVNSQIEFVSTTAGIDNVFFTQYYDLTGGSASIKVVDAGNQSLSTWETGMDVNTSEGYAGFNISGGTIYAQDTGSSNLASATYNPATMVYLKIRESSGTTYWDYSADGGSWNNLYSEANPIDMSTAVFEIWAYAETEASTTASKYDDFNIVGTPVDNYSGRGIGRGIGRGVCR